MPDWDFVGDPTVFSAGGTSEVSLFESVARRLLVIQGFGEDPGLHAVSFLPSAHS